MLSPGLLFLVPQQLLRVGVTLEAELGKSAPLLPASAHRTKTACLVVEPLLGVRNTSRGD